MIERFKLWFECEFLVYMKLVWMMALRKIDIKDLAEMTNTKIIYKDWTQKLAIKNAIKRNDVKQMKKLIEEAEIEERFDEEGYKAFLRTILRYQIFSLVCIAGLLLILVFIIGGR